MHKGSLDLLGPRFTRQRVQEFEKRPFHGHGYLAFQFILQGVLLEVGDDIGLWVILQITSKDSKNLEATGGAMFKSGRIEVSWSAAPRRRHQSGVEPPHSIGGIMMRAAGMFLIVVLAGVGASLGEEAWTAQWIAPADASLFDYGVYHFRKTFELEKPPASFVVHASADNRYELFVNGTRVALGPARGDLFHWRFETVDIAPQLKPGRNALAAVVWNFGEFAPEAQQTRHTGFILQGDGPAERVADTNAGWKCRAQRSLPAPQLHPRPDEGVFPFLPFSLCSDLLSMGCIFCNYALIINKLPFQIMILKNVFI